MSMASIGPWDQIKAEVPERLPKTLPDNPSSNPGPNWVSELSAGNSSVVAILDKVDVDPEDPNSQRIDVVLFSSVRSILNPGDETPNNPIGPEFVALVSDDLREIYDPREMAS